MYKCDKCGFECASNLLLMQHSEWCGTINEDGKLITETEYKQQVQNNKLEKMKQSSSSSEY